MRKNLHAHTHARAHTHVHMHAHLTCTPSTPLCTISLRRMLRPSLSLGAAPTTARHPACSACASLSERGGPLLATPPRPRSCSSTVSASSPESLNVSTLSMARTCLRTYVDQACICETVHVHVRVRVHKGVSVRGHTSRLVFRLLPRECLCPWQGVPHGLCRAMRPGLWAQTTTGCSEVSPQSSATEAGQQGKLSVKRSVAGTCMCMSQSVTHKAPKPSAAVWSAHPALARRVHPICTRAPSASTKASGPSFLRHRGEPGRTCSPPRPWSGLAARQEPHTALSRPWSHQARAPQPGMCAASRSAAAAQPGAAGTRRPTERPWSCAARGGLALWRARRAQARRAWRASGRCAGPARGRRGGGLKERHPGVAFSGLHYQLQQQHHHHHQLASQPRQQHQLQ